jgi:hypothetical protein
VTVPSGAARAVDPGRLWTGGVATLAPFLTDADLDEKVATAAIYLAIGIAIGSLLSGVAAAPYARAPEVAIGAFFHRDGHGAVAARSGLGPRTAGPTPGARDRRAGPAGAGEDAERGGRRRGRRAPAGAPRRRRHPGDHLSDLVVDSIAAVARTSERGRFIALIFGGFATLVAAGGVVEVLRWIHVLAWRVAPGRERHNAPLVPGARLFAGGFLAYTLAVTLAVTRYFAPRAARASAVYGSLGMALVLLVSLFLFGRLAVAAAELNATLWERRREPARP